MFKWKKDKTLYEPIIEATKNPDDMQLLDSTYLGKMLLKAEQWEKKASKNKQNAAHYTSMANNVFEAERLVKEAGQTIEEYDARWN